MSIPQDLDVDGHTNLDNVSIAGVSTFSGDIDVDGHTNLDNVSISGITTTNQITISSSGPRLTFSDSNENPDFYIEVNASQFLIQDATANAQRFRIQSNGVIDIAGNTNFSAGIDVTGGPIAITNNVLTITAGGSQRFNVAHTSGGTVLVKNPSNASLNLGTNNLQRIQIASDGKVQIGLPGSTESFPNGYEVVNIRAMAVSYTHLTLPTSDLE